GPHDAAASVEASAARFGVLQRAIERLCTKVEEARDGRRPGGGPEISTPSPTVTTSPIITVPASAGVATVPGPQPALVQQRSVPAFRRDEREAQGVPSTSPRERRKDPTDDIMARPLSSVDVLTPVEGLTIRPVGRERRLSTSVSRNERAVAHRGITGWMVAPVSAILALQSEPRAQTS